MAKFATILALICLVAALLLGSRLLVPAPPDEWQPGKPFPKEKITIGVLYLDKADSSGYSFAHETGIQRMQRETGLADNQIIRKFDVSESDRLQTEHAIRDAVAQGANVIVATSWGYMDTCEKLAKEFPAVVFAHASGYKSNPRNFTNYFGRIHQARYLGGIAAGMKTKTGKVGYVAAMGLDNSEVTSGVNAFALGVESVNPDARIHVRVTNSWYDPAGERRAAQLLMDGGCDVVAQHCDTPEPQLAAQEAGKWGIGYNTDMTREAPAAVLASVVWNWDVYYTRLVKSIINGTFSTKPYTGDMRDGMVGLTPLAPDLAEPGMAEAIQAARTRILDGSFGVFDGVLETADGRSIGEAGGTLSESAIGAGMDWYYKTVVVDGPRGE